jgi:hypothetical protein
MRFTPEAQAEVRSGRSPGDLNRAAKLRSIWESPADQRAGGCSASDAAAQRGSITLCIILDWRSEGAILISPDICATARYVARQRGFTRSDTD